MKKWTMTILFSTSVEFTVEAENYNEAVKAAYAQAREFPVEAKELEYELADWEELPEDE